MVTSKGQRVMSNQVGLSTMTARLLGLYKSQQL